MLPVGGLSYAANKLRDLFVDKIADLETAKQIRIGNPKESFEEMEKEKDKNHLNIFFYNVTYDGYPADGLSAAPFYLRLYCLITPKGATKDGHPSPGENDLRLINEVMRVLHEHPVILVNDANNSVIAQLQAVLHQMNLDNLNHIWSTQGDTPYRLSVAYEMSLAPVPLAKAVERSPLVGEIGSRVKADMEKESMPGSGFAIKTAAPVVLTGAVDVTKSGWSPHICFVNAAGDGLAYTLLLSKTLLPAAGFLGMKVCIAGKAFEQVNLIWETWNSGIGWMKSDLPQGVTVKTDTVDPENFDLTLAADTDLPLQGKGQGTLYAERTWEQANGSKVILRSNPLLVTVYEAGL